MHTRTAVDGCDHHQNRDPGCFPRSRPSQPARPGAEGRPVPPVTQGDARRPPPRGRFGQRKAAESPSGGDSGAGLGSCLERRQRPRPEHVAGSSSTVPRSQTRAVTNLLTMNVHARPLRRPQRALHPRAPPRRKIAGAEASERLSVFVRRRRVVPHPGNRASPPAVAEGPAARASPAFGVVYLLNVCRFGGGVSRASPR